MRWFSPRRLLIISISSWLFLMLLAPMSYMATPSLESLLVLFSYIVFFVTGTYCYSFFGFKKDIRLPDNNKARETTNLQDSISLLCKILIVLSMVGIILRYYDLFFLKSYMNYDSASDFRINYDMMGSNNFLSVLSALFFPFPIPLLLIIVYLGCQLRKPYRIVAGLLGVSLLVYVFLIGGRTLITLLLAMVVTSLALSQKLSRNTWYRFFRWAMQSLVIGSIFVFYSMYVLEERLQLMGFSLAEHLAYMEKYRNLIINETLMEFVYENSAGSGLILYTMISLFHYFVHGVYQYFLLVDHFNTDNIVFGALQYYPIMKFIGLLGADIMSMEQIVSLLETPGVYTTFYGPVYVDFGYFGFIYMFVLGLAAQYCWKNAKKRKNLGLLLYPYVASVILHSSFINMIQSGMGLYVLFSLIVSGWLCSFFKILLLNQNHKSDPNGC